MFRKRILFFLIFLLSLSGCATVPPAGMLPSYNISGATYYSLASLCGSRGINLEFDTFTRTAVLSKESHKINLRVGDGLILVDGKPMHLSRPIDFYQDLIVVPAQFKEQVVDSLFKEQYSARKTASLKKLHKIVLDPGHGGKDPGAIGRTGLREDGVNLDIAKRLRNLLVASGVEVVMTRSSDRFITLSDRVHIANNSGADLFVSIHSNANRSRALSGFEVYYVSPTVSDSQRASSSARNLRLNIGEASFSGRSQNLKAILWDMVYTNSRAESIELSRSVCRAIDGNLDTRVIGVKGARYMVLKGAHIPAILIEVGFLSNAQEERLLRSGSYRQKIAEGILEGIEDYAQCMAIMEANKR